MFGTEIHIVLKIPGWTEEFFGSLLHDRWQKRRRTTPLNTILVV
jgi:hypothetical protein